MRHFVAKPFGDDRTAIHDCWNRIGVRGDKSCPELAKHSNCGNCPAFSAAAVSLLDRDIPNGSAAAPAIHFAEPKTVGESRTVAAMMFRLGAEWFALSTLVLDEVVGLRAIHSLPHRRNPIVLGLVNVRGELVVCVSLARLLGGEAAAPAQGRLVVVRHESGRLAFPVDEVQHTHRYHPHELKPVPATVARSAAGFTRGLLPWRDRMAGCLDEQLVLQALNRSFA